MGFTEKIMANKALHSGLFDPVFIHVPGHRKGEHCRHVSNIHLIYAFFIKDIQHCPNYLRIGSCRILLPGHNIVFDKDDLSFYLQLLKTVYECYGRLLSYDKKGIRLQI